MTYGLIPRLVTSGDGVPSVHWDDLSAPQADVVVARMVSSYRFPAYSGAEVAIAHDFLQDYATVRGRALIQVYYAQRAGPLTLDVREALGGDTHAEFRLKGRLLDLRLLPGDRDLPILAQVWGVRLLLQPGDAPVSTGRWEYGSLAWPGIQEPVTNESSGRLSMLQVAYVCDSVLGLYEGRPEFSVHPESGAVSYGGQWSVSTTWRVGRDLIAVDLKRLYEGARPETVRYWHTHAVSPPPDPHAARDEPNVGTRARRIVYGLARLGEALLELAAPARAQPVSATDFVRLDRAGLEYHGWWTADQVEPITRHIPLTLDRDGFLSRCNDLNKLVVEGLVEKILRRALVGFGVPPDDLANVRSLRLLDRIVRLADLANRSGLRLPEDATALLGRMAEEQAASPITRLFALNELRQLIGHRVGESERQRFADALRTLRLDPAAYSAGWGRALDAVYDGVGETLEAAAETLTGAARTA